MLHELIVLGGGYLGYRWWQKRKAATGTTGTPDSAYTFVSGYTGGAKDGDDVPLVVLLHDQASTPSEALAAFPLSRPARLVTAIGRFPDKNGVGADARSFFDRNLTGDARDTAIRDEVRNLGTAIVKLVEASDYGVMKKATPLRAVIVALGATGSLGVALALTNPLHVRQAWTNNGGGVPPNWVPLALPQLNNLTAPYIRKLSYGNAVALDESTAKVAAGRGYNYEARVVDGPEAAAKVWRDEWFPAIEELITAP